nr:MAG TPA: hypothetical protein [Caudoviricetes sp.]
MIYNAVIRGYFYEKICNLIKCINIIIIVF